MEKTPEDALQQELLKERAEVLGRAGHSVDRALTKLRDLGKAIDGRCHDLNHRDNGDGQHASPDLSLPKRQIIQGINKDISRYNRLREYAQLRYHYLIITREAIGLRRHQRVEEIYPIPPKRKHLQEI